MREFKGTSNDPELDVTCGYEQKNIVFTRKIKLTIFNRSSAVFTMDILNSYDPALNHKKVIKAGERVNLMINNEKYSGWYDVSVSASGDERFLKRFAGRVENGKTTITDPIMGGEMKTTK